MVLVHGYTGSSSDLAALATKLAEAFGPEGVVNICLPGHDNGGNAPLFERDLFLKPIQQAARRFLDDDRALVLVGHSTGGTLLLSLLSETGWHPRLLVLAGTPRRVSSADLDRWQRHRVEKPDITFSSIARMVSVINHVDAGDVSRLQKDTNVLILHGLRDQLVLPETPCSWTTADFPGPARQVILNEADHYIFGEGTGDSATEILKEAIEDVLYETGEEDRSILKALGEFEPEGSTFLKASPCSSRHLAACPSARNLLRLPVTLAPEVATEAVFANIEITTRCNLSCGHCARRWLTPEPRDMPIEAFVRVLERLPHAYRITLVGLGEPLLHPDAVEFVALAARDGRRVALVTNGMNLNGALSDTLLDAGLQSVAFSLDAHEQTLAADLRPGTDLNRIALNVRGFAEKARQRSGVSTAVFSALSTKNIQKLSGLIEFVADLGVHVLMLTDLNFAENVVSSLWAMDRKDSAPVLKELQQSVRLAFSRGLPVISVDGLEAFGLFKTYRDYFLLSPGRITTRSEGRRHCFSPWQTLPVNVDGDVTLCDCQPEVRLGNLMRDSLSTIWNGPTMVGHRRAMLDADPPDACRVCPRF